MSGPRERRTAQYRKRHKCRLAASPSGRRAEEDHHEVKTPGNERQGHPWIADPGRARLNKCPSATGDHSERDKHEPKTHRIRDQIVEGPERRQALEDANRFLLFELSLLQ